jgi:hypothetical protein
MKDAKMQKTIEMLRQELQQNVDAILAAVDDAFLFNEVTEREQIHIDVDLVLKQKIIPAERSSTVFIGSAKEYVPTTARDIAHTTLETQIFQKPSSQPSPQNTTVFDNQLPQARIIKKSITRKENAFTEWVVEKAGGLFYFLFKRVEI